MTRLAAYTNHALPVAITAASAVGMLGSVVWLYAGPSELWRVAPAMLSNCFFAVVGRAALLAIPDEKETP